MLCSFRRVEAVTSQEYLILFGLIWRNLSYLDGPLFKNIFTLFVRPLPEHDQVIWAPYL